MPVTKYVWDVITDTYLMETDENDATTAVYTNEPGQFGPVISQRRGANSHFFHQDGLGSVVDVTDAAEDPTDSYVYKGYGEIVAATGSTTNPFRWVGSLGYYYDLGLLEYYVRARHYDPRSARWLSLDPIGYDGGDENLYGYVGEAPTTVVDPFGLWLVYRRNKPKAQAIAEKGDTWRSLAHLVGLDVKEIDKWLTPPRFFPGGVMPRFDHISNYDSLHPLCPGDSVEVPNTMVAFWEGELGPVGRKWVLWPKEIEYLKERGFFVLEHLNDKPADRLTPAQFLRALKTGGTRKELHGFFLWSHGHPLGFGRDKFQVLYKDFVKALEYTMAFVLLNVCYGDYKSGERYEVKDALGRVVESGVVDFGGRNLVSGTPGHKFWGKKKKLFPVGVFDFEKLTGYKHTWHLLRPGEQGTKGNE